MGQAGPSRPSPGRGSGWSLQPYKPPLPPAGSYDPALNAQLDASHRGILDVRQDTELGLSRAGQDFTFGSEDLNRGLARGEQDYARNTGMLQRSFNILAGQQAQAQRQMGVSTGGAVLQAAAKRKANQAVQQQGLDVGIARAREDTATGLGRLGVGYNRQVTDFTTGQSRAERENTAFGGDVLAQKYFQAAQSNWEPPPVPSWARKKK